MRKLLLILCLLASFASRAQLYQSNWTTVSIIDSTALPASSSNYTFGVLRGTTIPMLIPRTGTKIKLATSMDLAAARGVVTTDSVTLPVLGQYRLYVKNDQPVLLKWNGLKVPVSGPSSGTAAVSNDATFNNNNPSVAVAPSQNVVRDLRDAINTSLSARVVHVADIASLTATAGSAASSVVVRDVNRGGTFTYAASGQTTDNGVVFPASGGGFWVRQFSGAVNLKWFEATGNGTTDDRPALQAAINAANNLQKDIIAPEGSYLIKGQLYLRNVKVTGIPRRSKIIIASDFVFTETIAGRAESCILSNDFQGQSNAFSNEIYLEGLDIECRLISSGEKTLLGFANVKRGGINNCVITINAGLQAGVNAIDLWASVKNFTIRDCEIYNRNQSVTGGSIWIRNITNDGTLEANNTENILVENCRIWHATKDEPLAVYGVQGVTRNVTVRNTYVEALPSSQARSVLVSVFPLDNGTTQGANAAVRDVLFDNCTFVDSYFVDHVVRVGQSGLDANNVCDNVTIQNCTIRASLAVSATSHVLRNITGIGTNNKAIGNTVIVATTGQAVSNGISGFDVARGNNLTGRISNAIVSCTLAENNILNSVTGNGFVNCRTARNNIATIGGHGVLINGQSFVYNVIGNIITNSDATGSSFTNGIYIQSIGGLNPACYIAQNAISMSNGTLTWLRREGSGSLTLINNIFSTGAGVNVTNGGTPATIITGNLWGSNSDDRRATAYIANINAIYPVGHTIINSGATQSPWSFRKIASNNNSSDWTSI